ncbi:hypothetical protein niasHT_037807 [Heterodera trifolii]|uniref:peptidylprolyl isomerase n=1 Tax=Heterodera trifolii TaxID=157864 RepID=A0ABD2IQ62_9BILA
MASSPPNLVEETENPIIDVTKAKDGGVLKTVLKQGEDPKIHPAKSDCCYVHYVGTIKESGKVFDSSRARNTPFFFSLLRGQVIKGWDLCVATMCRGEIARVECRPDYAYGVTGHPPKVPGNATLIFEGEDLSPDRDGTITKSILVLGKKFQTPTEHAGVTVHAVGTTTDGRVFFDAQLDYVLGEGLDHGLPDGVDKALKRMDRGEKSRVTLKGKFGYGKCPPAELGLGIYEEIVFTLHLKDYEKVKATWELTDEEKLDRVKAYKDRGTDFLHQGKFALALAKYDTVIYMMEFAKPTKAPQEGGDEIAAKFEQMFVAAQLNSALAHLRMGDPIETIKHCEKVLERQPNNVKAIYRKAQAYQLRKDFEDAIATYQHIVELEAENKAAQQAILDCRAAMAAAMKSQRKQFKGMFDRSKHGEAFDDDGTTVATVPMAQEKGQTV